MSQLHGHTDSDPIDGLPTALHLRLLQLKRWGGESELRAFAIWCAETTRDDRSGPDPTLLAIKDAVRRRDDKALAQVNEVLWGAAGAAGTIGMKVGPSHACSFFAVFGSTFPDPFDAAIRAARSMRRCFRFREHKYPPSPSVTGDPATEADGEALGRQIDYIDQRLSRPVDLSDIPSSDSSPD